jgi:hypothetical protein
MNHEEVEDALQLVNHLCTFDQIQALLRQRKGNEHIRITAETKEDLVSRNLRQALEAKAIEVGAVFDLIRDAEENGNQHIFYYKPKARNIADALTYEIVAQRLWGEPWKNVVAEFPSIRLKPNDYKFSDLRPSSKKPKDWILKVYGENLITRATGKVEQRGANVYWREYIEEQLRVVLVVRWNNPDLLELRVQRNESRKRVEGWRNKLWEMLKPVMVPTQFEEWRLAVPMARLIQQPNNAVYTFRDASVVDATGVHASFQTYEDQGDLFTSLETRKALQNFLAANSECKGLTVTWLPGPNGIPEKETRTLLAAKEPHEIVALAHCSSEDLDYVTNQLRGFSKKTS